MALVGIVASLIIVMATLWRHMGAPTFARHSQSERVAQTDGKPRSYKLLKRKGEVWKGGPFTKTYFHVHFEQMGSGISYSPSRSASADPVARARGTHASSALGH